MPNRINPIARYLFALSAMIVAYTLYAKLAVPFLEGPPNTLRRKSAAIQTAGSGNQLHKDHLPGLVPADAWELEPCKTLLTPQGTIYFREWNPVDDEGTYSLTPFTIVMNDPVNQVHSAIPKTQSEKKPTPIVLRAQKGAQLKFNKSLTAQSGSEKVEMESAWLEGQVTLFRPENIASKEQELRFVTSNIQINRQHVFTLDDVYFSIGSHRGSGRNLSIKLAHEADSESPDIGFDDVKGVEQLELAYVSELLLNPSPGSAFSRGTKPAKAEVPLGGELSMSNQKTPLRLSCEGPFIFRMQEQKAWFRDKVQVVQLNDFGDNLKCDTLQIEFGKTEGKSTSIKNLVAVGSSENPAVINAISRQTKIVGQELNFDVLNSVVIANGSRPVQIRNPKLAFVASSLWYQLGDSGKLGKLNASGPGRVQGVSSNGQQSFQVDWANRLTTESIDSERVRIDIDRQAKMRFDDANRITADKLSLVIWQIPAAGAAAEQPAWKYLPSQLTSTGNVSIESEKLAGTAEELVANWPRPEQQFGNVQRSVFYSVCYRKRQDDAASSEVSLVPDRPAAQKMDRPTKFSGTRVVAEVNGDLDDMQIRSLAVDGKVALEAFPTGQPPISIAGHAMRLVPQGPELYRVTVESNASRMATFRTNGFLLNGQNLQLDQRANTVWVQGKGDLEIDAAKNRQRAIGSADQEMTDLEKVDVDWAGGMVFDGSKIYFEDDVRLNASRLPDDHGERAVINTRSAAVTIELSQRVQFEQLNAANKSVTHELKPGVRQMTFAGEIANGNRAFKLASHEQNRQRPEGFESQNVLIENATFDAAGKLTALQKLIVPSATASAESGDVRTAGPGTAISYQFSNGKRSSRLSGFSQTNPRPRSDTGPELSCVHCRFDGQLVANSKRGTMVINENTRSAWSVVGSFDETIDPDRPDQLPLGAAVLKSDRLEFAQWTPRNGVPRQEMRAEGNTSVRSQLFEALAHRLSYTDETDILVIESNPPADAMLARRSSPTAEPKKILAQKILYRLSDQSFRIHKTRNIDIDLPSRK